MNDTVTTYLVNFDGLYLKDDGWNDTTNMLEATHYLTYEEACDMLKALQDEATRDDVEIDGFIVRLTITAEEL